MIKECIHCFETKILSDFAKDYHRPDGRQNYCKKCKRMYNSKRHHSLSIEQRLFNRAKRRAKIKQIEFSIKVSDIKVPSVCPVLGIILEKGFNKLIKDNSPSLDRSDNSKGYTKDNIVVMSQRANRLKNNGTLEDFISLVKYLEDFNAK